MRESGDNIKKRIIVIAVIVFLILLTEVVFSLRAYSSDESTRKGSTFTFYQENDLYAGTDRDYTNGTKLTWISPDLTEYLDDPRLPPWSHSLISSLPFIGGDGYMRTVSLSLGQNIYTPEDTDKTMPVDGERPYAGISYCAIGFHSRNTLIMDTWEIDLGIVGPYSYAEKTQKAVHRWTGSEYPNGWENQLRDEPFLNLYYERKWRLPSRGRRTGLGYDIIPHAGCAVGNAFTAVTGGGHIRFGWNLPNDFGTLPIRPGSDTNAPIDAQDPRCSQRSSGFGVHVFTTIDAYACLLDITLDGNSLHSSEHVKKYPFIMHISSGLGIVAGRFKITYAYVLRTKEYTTQKEQQRYGAITVSYSFYE